nr:integrase, catalytic region, zinc finger, CCHC-type, peptidase aspartic, catalytic [Tanacetum cinerariifolium]
MPSNDFKASFFLLLGFYYELRDFSWSSIAAMEVLEFHLWDDEYGKLELAMKMWNGVLKATTNMEVKEVIKGVQIILWYLDSGCSKHMTGDRSQLTKFIDKFPSMVKIRLGHNLFSVGQLCNSDLEVSFRQHTCFIRNLEGVDLLENAHLKTTYKNLFDSISVSRVQTETKIASLQNELQCNIYKNAKLRTQLFKKVSDQKDNNQDSSKNTKFVKQPITEILHKIGETNAFSKPVTSNSVSTPPVSKGVNNAKVIAPGIFKISLDKVSREDKKVPNSVSASSRKKPITVS